MSKLARFIATHKTTCSGSCPACMLIVEIEKRDAQIAGLERLLREDRGGRRRARTVHPRES